MKFAQKSYYEILDIDPRSSAEDIHRSYRSVKTTWDPGSLATYSLYTPAESDLISRKVDEAFRILTDGERRRRYDHYLRFVNDTGDHFKDPTSFWQAVEGREDEHAHDITGLSELLTSAPVERVEATQLEANPDPASEGAHPSVEAEWEEVISASSSDAAPPEIKDAPTPTPRSGREAPMPALKPLGRKAWAAHPKNRSWTQKANFARGLMESRSQTMDERPLSSKALASLVAEHGLSGPFLQAVREAKGISIEDIAQRTKIGITYLCDIEAEAFDDLPATVYLRGFVSQYVSLLKLDTERVVDAYLSRYEATRKG